MRIHQILKAFILISMISCQSLQPEEKESLSDGTKELTQNSTFSTLDTTTTVIENEGNAEGPDSNFIHRKLEKGIDFYATGTEPFWSLDLDFENLFAFSNMDGFKLNTPATEKMKSRNPTATRYSIKVESGEMVIVIVKKECINAMSGLKSPYEVTVRVKSSVDADFKDYKGCGRYTSASGLAEKSDSSSKKK